ncbi:RNA 3'-terminal phosphate cyclase [Stetteria hydrogenophila]
MARVAVIDGSMGEGGGQILRTAIALSAVTGIPVRIYNIRAKRRNPGLRPQHLTAVKAVAELCGARVEGARVGSMELTFTPGRVRSGSFRFDVGTAGSVSLVLQALLPVLAYAPGPVEVEVRGGTDVPMAPTIDYVRFVLAGILRAAGYEFEVQLIRRGHYPRGGGVVRVRVDDPPGGFRAVRFTERGGLRAVRGVSHAVRLPRHVAERQARAAAEVVRRELGVEAEIELDVPEPGRDPHLGPGSGILVYALFDGSIMGGDALGARGKRAEVVGREAAEKLVEDVKTGAALDRYMSDMIIIYAALARGVSEFTGARLTMHAWTVLKLVEAMVEGFTYKVEGSIGEPFKATVHGLGVTR